VHQVLGGVFRCGSLIGVRFVVCVRFCFRVMLDGGKWLLCRILSIMFSSCFRSLLCRSYVFNLLCMNLTAAYFCCIGWLEV
jgi:hypothetical protein